MFIFGASMFTYRGNGLNPIVSKLGMYSFFLWLPTIAVGIFIMLYRPNTPKNRGTKNDI